MGEPILRADDAQARRRRQRRLLLVSFLASVLCLLCCMLGVALLGSWRPASPAAVDAPRR